LREAWISDFREFVTMSTIVKLQRKGQVTIPTRLHRGKWPSTNYWWLARKCFVDALSNSLRRLDFHRNQLLV